MWRGCQSQPCSASSVRSLVAKSATERLGAARSASRASSTLPSARSRAASLAAGFTLARAALIASAASTNVLDLVSMAVLPGRQAVAGALGYLPWSGAIPPYRSRKFWNKFAPTLRSSNAKRRAEPAGGYPAFGQQSARVTMAERDIDLVRSIL